jgi:pimeloyl-ACP methyl ester carboxylesterase
VIILESHNGGTVSNWVWVQSELAESARVCAYDRDGLGWSDLAPQPLDTRQNAQALHALLQAAGVPAPYVLVGHSFGGLYVRTYADLYPDEVAGMALIEPTNPTIFQVQGKPDVMPGAEPMLMEFAPYYARFGLVRLGAMFTGDPALPDQQREETTAFYKSTKFYQTLNRQYRLFPTLLAQVRETGDLDSIPLVVILGSKGDGGDELHVRLFNEQAALSSNHAVCTVEGAGHISLVDQQDHAAQTTAAILQVLQSAVTGEPVTCAP